eukprot:scaffold221137_cov38-Prasinocladus_malaysianus.AAC.1
MESLVRSRRYMFIVNTACCNSQNYYVFHHGHFLQLIMHCVRLHASLIGRKWHQQSRTKHEHRASWLLLSAAALVLGPNA